MEFMTGEWFGRLVQVLIVNLILSGDNAVVIAMAARTLEGAAIAMTTALSPERITFTSSTSRSRPNHSPVMISI